jgi:hypothetical protein
MDSNELLSLIERGETSTVQFKSNVHNEQSIAQEMVAFANSQGGKILIVSFSATLLPYSGLGSGIKRSLEEQPNIEFYNDIDGEQFKVIIPRPVKN